MSSLQPQSGTLGRPHYALRRVVTRYFAGLLLLALLAAATFVVMSIALKVQAQDSLINRLVFEQLQSFYEIEDAVRALQRTTPNTADATGAAGATGTAAGAGAAGLAPAAEPDEERTLLHNRIRKFSRQITASTQHIVETSAERARFLPNPHPIFDVYMRQPHRMQARLELYLDQVAALKGEEPEAISAGAARLESAEIRQLFEVALKEADDALIRDLAALDQFVKGVTLFSMIILLSEALFLLMPVVKKLRIESAQIRLYESELRRQANEDQLTGLANRSMFYETLRHWIAKADAEGTTVSLILFDLDRFKPINDTLGHQTGDRLLEQVAHRARGTLCEGDMIARLGGDEFGVISRQDGRDGALAAQIKKLVAVIEVPVSHGEWEFRPSASFGCAVFPDHARAAEELFAAADAALYEAKKDKSAFQIYDSRMRAADEENRQLARDLRHAVANGQLTVHYQPQFDIPGMTPIGFEALVRWTHPRKGVMGAGEFVPIAEKLGLVPELTTEVVETVARDIRRWLDDGRDPGIVSINMPEEMFAMGIAEPLLDRSLARERIPFNRICVEVTEDVFLNRASDQIAEILARIRERGMRVAFDDFGTGYASLSHLKAFPVDDLKIDRSFIDDIGKDERGSVIIRALLGLARNLKKDVVAEGVETMDQYRFLSEQGCTKGQGFIYAKPMPFAAATSYTLPLNAPGARGTAGTPGAPETPASTARTAPNVVGFDRQGAAAAKQRGQR